MKDKCLLVSPGVSSSVYQSLRCLFFSVLLSPLFLCALLFSVYLYLYLPSIYIVIYLSVYCLSWCLLSLLSPSVSLCIGRSVGLLDAAFCSLFSFSPGDQRLVLYKETNQLLRSPAAPAAAPAAAVAVAVAGAAVVVFLLLPWFSNVPNPVSCCCCCCCCCSGLRRGDSSAPLLPSASTVYDVGAPVGAPQVAGAPWRPGEGENGNNPTVTTTAAAAAARNPRDHNEEPLLLFLDSQPGAPPQQGAYEGPVGGPVGGPLGGPPRGSQDVFTRASSSPDIPGAYGTERSGSGWFRGPLASLSRMASGLRRGNSQQQQQKQQQQQQQQQQQPDLWGGWGSGRFPSRRQKWYPQQQLQQQQQQQQQPRRHISQPPTDLLSDLPLPPLPPQQQQQQQQDIDGGQQRGYNEVSPSSSRVAKATSPFITSIKPKGPQDHQQQAEGGPPTDYARKPSVHLSTDRHLSGAAPSGEGGPSKGAPNNETPGQQQQQQQQEQQLLHELRQEHEQLQQRLQQQHQQLQASLLCSSLSGHRGLHDSPPSLSGAPKGSKKGPLFGASSSSPSERVSPIFPESAEQEGAPRGPSCSSSPPKPFVSNRQTSVGSPACGASLGSQGARWGGAPGAAPASPGSQDSPQRPLWRGSQQWDSEDSSAGGPSRPKGAPVGAPRAVRRPSIAAAAAAAADSDGAGDKQDSPPPSFSFFEQQQM